MKKIVFSLTPEAITYKGAIKYFEYIAMEIAKFNGGCYGTKAHSFFVETIVEECGSSIKLEKIDDVTYKIGHGKSGGKYVVYGTIIKINIL